MTDRPHFLCIGAHKAGTTWLYRNLRRHPALWLPPVKELHVFDGLPNLPRLTQRLDDAIKAQASGDPTAKSQPIEFLRKFVAGQPKDDAWYRSLFSEAGDRVCGEITPAYSFIKAERIERIHDFLPNLRIMFLMRDPIDRAWSHLRSDARKPGLDPATMSIKDMRRRIDSPVSELRTRYTRTLANWERFYSRDQFCVQFHDDIIAEPDAVLRAACGFLGVEFEESHFDETRRQKVHASVELPMPPEVRLHLARKYREEIAALQRRFGGRADRWLANCEAILNGAN